MLGNVNEKIDNDKIICDNCGWSWDIVDGGDDLYTCHKCYHDNTPKKNKTISEGNLNNFLKSKVFDRKAFIQKVERGGAQTKKAYAMLRDSYNNDTKLSDEEKEFVNAHLKKVLTTLGYGALFLIPGSMTTMALYKILGPLFKKKKL